jgi:hypothetical protein
MHVAASLIPSYFGRFQSGYQPVLVEVGLMQPDYCILTNNGHKILVEGFAMVFSASLWIASSVLACSPAVAFVPCFWCVALNIELGGLSFSKNT